MSEPDVVAEGRAAWSRIKSLTKPLFEDWMAIGRALIIGRAECMTAANSNGPHGPRYNRLIRLWLDDNGFGDIDTHERSNAIHMIEHEIEIMAWRDGLSAEARRRANHPHTIMNHWRHNTEPQKHGPKPGHHAEFKPVPSWRVKGRPVFFDQAMIRRAADAMRESRSNDWLVLANVALQAAIRNEGDVMELLPIKTPPAPSPAHAMAV